MLDANALIHEHDHRSALTRCPLCGSGRRNEYLRRICGLSPEMQAWRLEGWSATGPERLEALEAAREALGQASGWLTFSGEWGTGKSYLLAAMVNEARERGLIAVYVTMADLLDHLRDAFNPKAPLDYSALWDNVLEAQVLALDEIEKFRPTPWAEERFFVLVNARYVNVAEQLTVFATNQHVEPGAAVLEGTAWPGYLESRLCDGRFKIVHLGGGDVRPRLMR